MRAFRSVTVLALAALVAVSSGCKRGAEATVSGTVTSRGKRVTRGYVIFHGPEGRVAYGNINKDGGYSVANVPVGEVSASIGGMADAMPGGSAQPAKAPPAAKDRPPVPEKYYKPDTAGMKYTVKAGPQEIDLRAD